MGFLFEKIFCEIFGMECCPCVPFMLSRRGFIKNIGYNVFIENNLIVAGFYRWIRYSDIKCKLFHVFF